MVHKGVQGLLDAGIKLLALDFDLTICSAHTHGIFQGTADDLKGLLYPEMVALVQQAAPKLQVAVTTYSPQEDLIGQVMKLVCPKDKILIRGNFTCQVSGAALENGAVNEGKQTHIHSVLDELSRKGVKRLNPGDVLLVDDQESNVRTAVENGSYGLIFRGPSCISGLEKIPSKPQLLSCDCH